MGNAHKLISQPSDVIKLAESRDLRRSEEYNLPVSMGIESDMVLDRPRKT